MELIAGQINKTKSSYRWKILSLLFFSTTINYLDRNVLSILAPTLQKEYGWSEIDYGFIVSAFQLAYGLGVVFVGKLLDRVGNRIVFAVAIAIWSLASMGHALARTVIEFAIARFFLGLGESANFPACVKSVTEWFPRKERALATGIFNAGSNIGAILAPLLIPVVVVTCGWQWAFIFTGCFGLFWLICWLASYRLPEKHKRVSPAELAYINADEDAPVEKISWMRLLTRRETITLCLSRFFTDPVWWFLLYWLPKFLDKQYGVSLTELGLPLITIYIIADLGGISGGWLSSHYIKKGKGVNRSRKSAMLICALCALPIVFISQIPPLWVSVGLISLACAAHCGWAANIYTLVSDQYPKSAVATIIGISTFSAVLGSMLVSSAVGFVLEKTGSYSLIFTTAAFMYLLGWIIIQIGIPKIKPISFHQPSQET